MAEGGKSISVYVPLKLRERITTQADRLGYTPSSLVANMLASCIADVESIDPEEIDIGSEEEEGEGAEPGEDGEDETQPGEDDDDDEGETEGETEDTTQGDEDEDENDDGEEE